MSKLRFHEAILLGDSLRARLSYLWLTPRTPNCKCYEGCAIGGAALAAGLINRNDEVNQTSALDLAVEAYPWLRSHLSDRGWPIDLISGMFQDVCRGEMTIEALADQVKQWEDELDPLPEEPVQTEEIAAVPVSK